MTQLSLPLGALRRDRDAPPRVELRRGRAERWKIRDWFDRLGALGLPGLTLPSTIEDSAEGLALEYPPDSREGVPLEARVAEWGQDTAGAIPAVLGLARFTLDLAEGLSRHRFDDVPICPGLIHARPDESSPWRMIAIPSGAVTLADWSEAGPASWAWASPEALLAGRVADPVYTLGSALHHGLVGSMFPELLPDREKFARLLRGRVGMPSRLEATLRASTPARCRSDAEGLGRLALDCLGPASGGRPAESEARSRFEALEARLSAERLARSWDADNRPILGGRLRHPRPARPPGPGPAEEALDPRQEWYELARAHLDRGDVSAALASAWNALAVDGPHTAELYLRIVQRVAAIPRARSEGLAALSRMLQRYPAPVLGEANLLRVAHIRIRYFAAREAEVAPLLGASQTEWGRAVGLLLRAVYSVRKEGAYAETSRLCAEGSRIFAGMPREGEAVGRYSRAYLALLDGVAHVGFVAGGGPTDYYTDALERFGTALRLATEIGSTDLGRAAGRWLGWLGWLAGLTPGRSLAPIRTAADALLRLHGQVLPEGEVLEIPEVVAYDEAYLFPV